MTRTITFTQAQIRRAVKAVESTGLRVRRVTIAPDGSITVDGEDVSKAVEKEATATGWEDLDGQAKAEARK